MTLRADGLPLSADQEVGGKQVEFSTNVFAFDADGADRVVVLLRVESNGFAGKGSMRVQLVAALHRSLNQLRVLAEYAGPLDAEALSAGVRLRVEGDRQNLPFVGVRYLLSHPTLRGRMSACIPLALASGQLVKRYDDPIVPRASFEVA